MSLTTASRPYLLGARRFAGVERAGESIDRFQQQLFVACEVLTRGAARDDDGRRVVRRHAIFDEAANQIARTRRVPQVGMRVVQQEHIEAAFALFEFGRRDEPERHTSCRLFRRRRQIDE